MHTLFFIGFLHAFLIAFPNFLLSFFPHLLPMDPNEIFFMPSYLPTTPESKLLLLTLMRLINGLVIGYSFLYLLISFDPIKNKQTIYAGSKKKKNFLKKKKIIKKIFNFKF